MVIRMATIALAVFLLAVSVAAGPDRTSVAETPAATPGGAATASTPVAKPSRKAAAAPVAKPGRKPAAAAAAEPSRSPAIVAPAVEPPPGITALIAEPGPPPVSTAPVAQPSPRSTVAAAAPDVVAPIWTMQLSQTSPLDPLRPGVRAGSSESEPLLTLDDALAIALKDNRGMRTAALEVEKAEDRIGAARTRRLPSIRVGVGADYPMIPIDLTFKQGDFGTYPGIGPVPSRETTLSTQKLLATATAGLVQPIAQQYRLGLTVDQLGVARSIAREDLRAQRHAVVSEVKQAYYLVLQAQSGLDAVQEGVRSLRELDRVVTEQLAERKALRADSLDVKTRLAQAESDAFTMSNRLATRKEELNHMLGRETSTGLRVSPVPEVTLFETHLETAQAQAIQQRPELSRAELQVRLADYDLKIKKSEFIPDVDLFVRYAHPATSDRLPQNVALVGVALTWEIFDWGRKRQEAAERERTMQQAKTTAAEMRSRIIIDVNTRFRALEETKARLRVADLGLAAARERLQVVTARYAERVVLLADVLQAQAAVAVANDQYQGAILTFWTARADFERALGDSN